MDGSNWQVERMVQALESIAKSLQKIADPPKDYVQDSKNFTSTSKVQDS